MKKWKNTRSLIKVIVMIMRQIKKILIDGTEIYDQAKDDETVIRKIKNKKKPS